MKRKGNIRAQSVIGINFNKFKSTGLIQFISLSLRKKKMFDTVHEGRFSGICHREDISLFGLDTSGIIYEFKRRQFGLKVIARIYAKRCKKTGD